MGVAVEIEVTRSRGAARWAASAAAVSALGLVLAGLQLASGPTVLIDAPFAARVVFACVCGALAVGIAGVAIRDLRGVPTPGPVRRLRVDEAGEAVLVGPDPTSARPMALRASCTLPGLTLLVMAPYLLQPPSGRRARPTVLLLGRDAVPAQAWRRLHVWLRWMERGRSGP
jgi:hypothetical protein